MLVHGLGLGWRRWDPVMAQLADGRGIFAYDIRGHGTATEAPPPSDMHVLANDLRQLLDPTGPARVQVAGLFHGGGIAQTIATRRRGGD